MKKKVTVTIKENKKDRFIRLANKRVNNVLDQLRLIGNLSDSRYYDYSQEDIKKIFSSIQKLPKYKVYAITETKGEKSKTLIYDNYTESEFEYNFIPKNVKDNSFEIKAFFPLDSILVEIPGKITME